MRTSTILSAILLGTVSVSALSNPHERAKRNVAKPVRPKPIAPQSVREEKRSTKKYATPASSKFAVDGKAIPEVAFDIGESYAGLLPNTPHGNSSLWFWFFPSENPKAEKEITIWLNGGPGCSSLDGLLQEHGPFLWQSGTYAPVKNPYSWTNLTNIVYIDQPAGTGFSPGPPSVKNEIDVANQFNDFWKRFMTTFAMEGYKVYITGESYAGQYIPYIADNMLKRKDPKYYNLKGIEIIDPSVNEDDVIIEAPAVRALNKYNSVIGLNDSFVSGVNKRADSCGYTAFMEESLTFPPKGKLPTAPSSNKRGCDVWDDIVAAAYYVNPCFNFYHLIDFCPYLWDEMGFPSLGGGPNNYFNRTDVQKALHTRPTNYMVCGEYEFLRPDGSVPSGLGPLPHVIEATNNVILAHGNLDFLLFTEGSLVTIQNMTWNGKQGFQKAPTDDFYVPYHPQLRELLFGTTDKPFTQNAGAGYLGKTHTERGLTFVTVDLAGHEIPQYTPGAAYRQLEFLLGRIKSLTDKSDFTTLPGDFTGTRAPFPPGEGLEKGIPADGEVIDGTRGSHGGRPE